MTCPSCGGALSLPLSSRHRVGLVVQTCKNYQACGRAVWSAAADVVVAPVIDDGSRHARYLAPLTSEPEPPVVDGRDRWTSIGRLARRELDALNRADRKLAAAGGDR